MRVAFGYLLIAASAACGSDDGGSPANPDAPPASDAPNPTSLRLTWTSLPPIPGPIKNDIDVATASFRLGQLQIVGDGGSGGATTLEDIMLEWSAEHPMPPMLTFAAAPLGLYSKISFDVVADASHDAFEITGAAKIGPVMEPFRIYDTEPLDIEISGYDVELEPGRSVQLTVQLDLKAVLESLDYEEFPVIGGVRTVGPADAQINAVREAMTDAFENPQN